MKSTFASMLVLMTLNSCGFLESNDNNKNETPRPDKHQVAVVGMGFDTDNAVFENKVKNAWDIRCQEMRHPFELLSGATRYEELKDSFLQYLELRKGCTIEKKINNEISTEFAKIAGDFNEWNSAVASGTIDRVNQRQKVQAILNGEDGKFNYNGTAAAGLIAEDNDSVELHIISVNLKRVILFNEIINGVGCRSQAEIDLKAQLFKDEEVVKAFVDAGREDADSLIAATLAPEKVTIVNESFGPSSIGEFEEYYRKQNCEPVKFRKYILAEAELQKARQAAIQERFGFRPLTVKAAGSAGQELNLVSDTSSPCEDNDNNIIVGALNAKDEIANFSNKGRCVDVYTLGANVKTFAPEDFRNVENGTIYSAPLLVRYLTTDTEPGASPEELREHINKTVDENKAIKLGDWNRDFAYEPKENNNQNPAPDNNIRPGNNEPNNQGNDQFAEGWTRQAVNDDINGCVQQTGTENSRKYCECAVEGLAKKYSVAEIQNMDQNQIGQDNIITECRRLHPW